MADSVTVTLPDSVSLTVTASEATALTVTAPASSSLSVTNKGPKGDKGDTGATGATGAAGSDGQGVPTGGVERQVIVKQSETDYDTAWEYVEAVYMQVKNDEGSALTSGTPLYVKGVQGSSILVGKACANNPATMPSTAILFEDLAIGATGEAIAAGLFNKTITGLTGVSIGDIVYVGNNGGLTATKPTASNELVQNVGIVIQTSGSNIQKMKVSAIGRTNDIPNLASGKFFIGGTTGQVSAYTLPTADGTNGQLLQTDGAGAVTFVDFSGSPWTTSGSDIYYTTGNVGVGTTTPSQPLHVDGNAKINGILDLRNSLDTDAGVIQVTDTSANNVSVGIGNMTSVGIRHIGIGEINSTSRVDYVGIGPRGVGGGNQSVVIGDEVAGNNSGTGIVAIGQNASRFSSGNYSVAIGNRTLYGIGGQGGIYSVAVGYQALDKASQYSVGVGANTVKHTSGANNVGIGHSAGLGVSGSSTFANTVAVGYQALTALTTGASNTAVGYQAGDVLTTGGSNTLLGHSAGGSITTGYFNTLIGASAGASSGATKQGRTIVGASAGQYNNGDNNTAVGFGALQYGSNTNAVAIGQQAAHTGGGSSAVHIGYRAGRNTTGNNNVTIGYDAGLGVQFTSTFADTVAVGYQALTALTTGAQNTAVGYQAGDALTTGANNTLVGYAAGTALTGSSNAIFGNSAGTAMTSGTGNVVVGSYAGGNMNTNINTVAIGNGADAVATTNYGVAVGASAKVNGSAVAVGYQALTNITTGAGNTAVGYQAGAALTTGGSNTLFGYQAGQNLTDQARNVAIGDGAMSTSVNGYDNTAVGHDALYSLSSVFNNNVAIGKDAARSVTGTSGSVFVGGSASTVSNANVNSVTVIGWSAQTKEDGVSVGRQSVGGTSTVTVGRSAGNSSSDSSVFLGYQAGSSETGDNKLYIENSNSTTPLIYGEFDNDILRVNGSFEVTGGLTADDGSLTAAGDYGKGAEVWYQGTSTPTAGSVYYLDSSGNWANTDASAVATAKGMLSVSAGADSDVDGMVIKGFVYVGTDPGGSVGDVVYLSETANQLTTTAPTTASAVVRVCGYKVGTNIVYFDPSKDWIELS
mgnify:CR=1 FL=1